MRQLVKTGRDLFAATSELVHLIGWMARDEGNQGPSHKYHLHSYQLAAEAGENELAATALRGLADQAIDLGHITTAVRLAQACEQRGRKLTNPKALAYYRNALARAAAADGFTPCGVPASSPRFRCRVGPHPVPSRAR